MVDEDPCAVAVARAQGLIQLYRRHARWALRTYRALQVVTVAAAGIATVLVFPKGVSKYVQAAFPLVAFIAAGLVTALDLRGIGGRDEVVATRMEGELHRFKTKVGKYSDSDHALETFVEAIERLEQAATLKWAAALAEQPEAQTRRRQTGQ